MAISEIDTVICETVIAAQPETVFAFFTEPDLYTRWMGARARLDPRPGGAYAVRSAPTSIAISTARAGSTTLGASA